MAGTLVQGAEKRWVSPLREIEEAVLERAKAAALDMSEPDGVDGLRRLLQEEVDDWRAAFRRGQRLQDVADPEGAVERGLRNLTG
jgi:hypothetical protein